MGKRETARVPVFAIGVSLFLIAAKVALPPETGGWFTGIAHAAEERSSKAVRDLKVSDIFISPDLGYVVETSQPGEPSGSPIIIHIQEAHTNYEAQQNLVKILERLVDRYGITLILVEGGEGDVGLADLRTHGTPERRQQVAEKYLRAGVLSAEEYLDIVSSYPLTIWGVEQEELYEQNLEAFLQAEELQASLKPILASVRRATDTLAPRLSNPALKELEAKIAAFEQDALGLGEYAGVLAGVAKDQAIALTEYPHFRTFQEVRQLEQTIALPQVQQEQQALMGELSRRAQEAQLKALIAQALELKAGKVTREAFYTSLEQLARSSQVDLVKYPNLSKYILYVKQSATIQPNGLTDDLTRLAARLRESLASTSTGQALTAITEQVNLFEKLLELRLSPQEYRRLKSLNVKSVSSTWGKFLSEELTRQGLPAQTFPGLSELERALPTLERFYEMAMARDQALVTNALSKLSATKDRVAVLITGGFHAPKITQLLKEQGVGTVVITPKVSQPTNERLYHAVLKYKSGHGSLQEVMAIANQQVSSSRSQ